MAAPASSGLEVADEAFCLLRQLPASAFAWYYLPTSAFLLGLLAFLAEMTANPFALNRVGMYSVALAVSYVFMRACQTLFCSRIYTELSGRPGLRARPRVLLKLMMLHAATSVYSLFVFPLTASVLLPLGWHYAYHQHLLTWPGDTLPKIGAWHLRAWNLCLQQSKQHHQYFFFLSIGRLLLFIAGVVLAVVLPGLLKSLFGWHTPLSESYWWLLNTTFLAGVATAVFLFADPLTKCFFVVRTWYAESRRSGDDLRAELVWVSQLRQRTLSRTVGGAMVAVAVWLALGPTPAQGESKSADTEIQWDAPVEADWQQRMDTATTETLQRRHFAWRMELDPEWRAEADRGLAYAFAESLNKLMMEMTRPIAEMARWIERMLRGGTRGGGGPALPTGNTDWPVGLRQVAWLLLGLMVVTVGILMVRTFKSSSAVLAESEDLGRPAIPDLEDESVTAAHLPENEWVALAEELATKEEWRTALRALFLATLAALGERKLVRIARHKSNREYQREFRRRAHLYPGVEEALAGGVRVFESAWYGWHRAGVEDYDRMRKILTSVQGGLHD